MKNFFVSFVAQKAKDEAPKLVTWHIQLTTHRLVSQAVKILSLELGILGSMLQRLQHFQRFILIKVGQPARYIVHNLFQRALHRQLSHGFHGLVKFPNFILQSLKQEKGLE